MQKIIIIFSLIGDFNPGSDITAFKIIFNNKEFNNKTDKPSFQII